MNAINRITHTALLVASLLMAHDAVAQCSFSSSSTGADGDFIPTTSMPTNAGWSVSGNVVTVTNYPTGVFNFKSIYIETNWTVQFTRNTLNTPVYLLATTNVTIKGTIDVSAQSTPPSGITGGPGGPGGFDGGTGVAGVSDQSAGMGPGAGGTNAVSGDAAGYGTRGNEDSSGGPIYGVLDIQPLIGGSGGSGGSNGGGGGGGAILIASSKTIDVEGTITSYGGYAPGGCNGGGGGSGGTIRLIANTIQGEGMIAAQGGNTFQCNAQGGLGRVRLEACSNTRISLTLPPATYGTPGVAMLATNPSIRIASINGINVTNTPAGSLTTPDMITNFPNPVSIKVTASNVTVGTTFSLIVTPVNGTNLLTTGTLTGSFAFSSNTVSATVYTDRVWRVNALINSIARP